MVSRPVHRLDRAGRTRRWLGGVTVAALLGTLAVGLPPSAPRAVVAGRSAAAPPAVVPVRSPQAADLDRLTTETTRVEATGRGTLRAVINARPVRVRTGTGWAPLDTTLVRRADGTIRPRRAGVALSLGGGGQRTIATMRTPQGSRVGLSWPDPLPEPSLAADKATYPEVLPGVDLVVQATDSGFAEVLVVKSARAARHAALSPIRFGLDTHRWSPQLNAFMWDSSGSRRAVMAVRTTKSELVITPDRAMLTDPHLVFPLYLDPWFPSSKQHWTMVEQDLPSQGWWDANVHARAGRDPAWSTTDTFRSYFQMDTAFLAGRHILSATFRARETYSYSCTPEPLNLWRTDPISASTSWSNAPALRAKLGTVNAAKGFSASCPPGDVEFDVKQLVVDAAAGSWANVTLGLLADEGVGTLGGKAFENNPSIAVEFNTPPAAPDVVATDTMPGCVGSPAMWVTTLKPRLKVSVRDDDIAYGQQHRINFEIRRAGGALVDAPEATPPTVLDYEVVDGVLVDGGRYEWRAKATDEVESGPWSAWCPFTVDISGPSTRPTLTTRDFPKFPAMGIRVDETGRFTFNALGDIDIVGFDYRISGPAIKAGRVTVAPGGATDLVFVPGKGGTYTVTLAGVDLAGNKGVSTLPYQFRIRPLPFPAVSLPLNEDSGTTAADYSTYGADGTVALRGGVSWVEGRHGGALHTDGTENTGGYAAGPPVDTANSFSMMAWVRARESSEAWRTAVAIAGKGPELQFDLGHWTFVMPNAGEGYVSARSDLPAQIGVWTHLAGVYDKALGTLTLYVNGRKAAEAPFTQPFTATGSLMVGGADCCMGVIRRWVGDLDEVQVYDFATAQRKVQEEMATFDLYGPEAWWQFSETSDVAAFDSTGNGHTLARGADTAWGPGRLGGGLAMTGGALTADRAILRTDASYSVAAWVRLDRDDGYFGAVSQDGRYDSGFQLGYSAYPQGWAFSAGNGDTDWNDSGPPAVVAASTLPRQLNVWTHLIGVYDHDVGELRLYVNGRLVAKAPYRSTRNATGLFAVGRFQSNGLPVGPWPGGIDEVRVAQHALTPEEVAAWLNWDHYGPKALWDMDEGTGTVVDDVSDNDHAVVTAGTTTWTTHTGKGNALHFDGSRANFNTGYPGSHAYTAGPVVRTDQSFTVAAWVRLTRDDTWYSAVSQDGENVSGFDLRYDALNRRWAFLMYGNDNPYNSASPPPEYAAGTATWDYQVGVWTHLAGVYDATAQKIYLYVNGQLRASAPCKITWNAGRALQVGRSRYNALPVNNWPGDIDRVFVQSGVLTAPQIAALM
ncbi:LamG-like jellyroll fold domain-containing protein [Micromonospora sp. MP36]|uniref:LamG-like jellyroll fold domain-containing protein n=1 Tax=Micromonospora sp. MP36 TaxID=2604468 RepID=UPI0011D60D9B|nr:LamG-like jellyroll fold domain-containing protein [Micromonospora sp. MP36]TYC19659.1 LamG domain-containing protein [Micromonospora sp. MP36]